MNESKEYIIYNNMLNEYQNVDVDKDCSYPGNQTFAFLAESLVKLNIKNPIKQDSDGCNEYNDMIYFYEIWPKEKKDCAFKKRFLYAAYQLCKLCPHNIFAKHEEVIEPEKKEEEKPTEKRVQINMKDNRMFGVVPQKGNRK